jgi:small subunit ribosomal protein S17
MARLNFLGFVISQGKMDKTIKVRILQKKFDKKVQKHFLQKKDYLVHDEGNICREGDLVRIEQTRPLSSKKFFAVAEIKKNKGQQFATYQKEAKTNVRKEEIEKMELLNKKSELFNKNNNESLYKDLSDIKELRIKTNLTEEEISQINQIKEKYNISTLFNSDSDIPQNKELFTTSVSALANKLESLSFDLKITNTLNDLLKDDSKRQIVDQICEKLEINSETKKNIKKNLIRKYLKSTPAEELQKLGLFV